MKPGKKVLLTIGWFFISLLSCNLQPRSWWNEATIAVMADPSEWEGLQGPLRLVYEHVVRTPQIEKTFTLIPVPESNFKRYTKFRYLILLATLESEGKVGKMVNQVITDPEIIEGIQNGKYYVFIQEDQWVADQLVVILISNDIHTLREKIETNKQFLYQVFEKDFNKRLTNDIIRHRYDKKLEKRLMETYNWTMQVQQDYFVAYELPKQGYIWFRRLNPERWMSVRWIADADTSYLNPNWIIKERNRIGDQYYQGHRISETFLFSHRTTFFERPAQLTTGVWEHDEITAGGPFKNYTFFDAPTKTIYMIDIALFAPHRRKLPLLRRMDVIARSFRTIFDEEE